MPEPLSRKAYGMKPSTPPGIGPGTVSPRKRMAMGDGSGFTVKAPGSKRHPDAKMTHMPMEDGNRATGPGISHADGYMPAQPAPLHGPHYHRR